MFIITSKPQVKPLASENTTLVITVSEHLSVTLTAGNRKLIRPLLSKVFRFHQNISPLFYKVDKVGGNDAA